MARRQRKKEVNLTEAQAIEKANKLADTGYSVTIKETSVGLWNLFAFPSNYPGVHKFNFRRLNK